MAFAICELLDYSSEETDSDDLAVSEEPPPLWRTLMKRLRMSHGGSSPVVNRHNTIVDWQLNPEVLKEMRRDIKRELRPTGNYTEERLNELAIQIVELVVQRSES